MGRIPEIPSQSDQAIFPMDMLALTPPYGTIMYEIGRGTIRFGVQDMALGLIQTFDEQPGSAPDYKEGTFIEFRPGNINAHVIKRGLTGEEVNEIGKICADIDYALFVSSFLPKALSETEKLISNLKVLSIPRTGLQEQQDANLKLEENISSLGVTVDRLKTSRIEQNERFFQLVKKAKELGITLISSTTGSMRSGSIAIPLITTVETAESRFPQNPQK